jgi:hypothetical protein
MRDSAGSQSGLGKQWDMQGASRSVASAVRRLTGAVADLPVGEHLHTCYQDAFSACAPAATWHKWQHGAHAHALLLSMQGAEVWVCAARSLCPPLRNCNDACAPL